MKSASLPAFPHTKIVGDDGQPQVVHHFTYFEFQEFDRHFGATYFGRDPEGIDTLGSWFTDNPDAPYAPAGMGGKKMDVHLNIMRPLYIDDVNEGDGFDQLNQMVKDAGGSTALRTKLQAQGYDGVVLNGTKLDTVKQNAILAFEPGQVRLVEPVATSRLITRAAQDPAERFGQLLRDLDRDTDTFYADAAAIIKDAACVVGAEARVQVEIQPFDLYGAVTGLEITDFFAENPGNGSGTKVMKKLTELADMVGLSIYLRPSCARNREFYARFDFKNDDRHHGFMVRYGKIADADLDDIQAPPIVNTGLARAKAMGFDTSITLYHGTDADFDQFDINFVGEGNGNGDWGDGFYFTDNLKAAEQYGSTIKAVFLKIRNPADISVMLRPEVQDALDDVMGFTSVQEVLEGFGFDGIVIDHKEHGKEYVVFSPRQIYVQPPLVPVVARNQRAEAQGFDTSKILYHGTTADFTEFKPGRCGLIYFSSNPEFASQFADGTGGSVGQYFIRSEKPFDFVNNPEHRQHAIKLFNEAGGFGWLMEFQLDPQVDSEPRTTFDFDPTRDMDWEIFDCLDINLPGILKSEGFDSLIYRDDTDAITTAVVDPGQIISAIGLVHQAPVPRSTIRNNETDEGCKP